MSYCDEPCPTVDAFLKRSPYLAEFNPNIYQGIWYELAFYADTNFYTDDFITSCPYETAWRRRNYTKHMDGTVNDKHDPFFYAGNRFSRAIFIILRSVIKNDSYDRTIQYQCKIDQLGKRVFTGVNFLPRTHFDSAADRKQATDEMINEALNAGAEQKYLQELKIVQWETCFK
ncbi:unnamed protein product [Rotaria socialis]|uniref:Uncharacterized protein n=1 Tax=Rotaria socialis TaxID=392032 RepID=A0A820VPI1_9BILA|nr:unnamed protein product [Rotaria socialis]CAF4306533.1 unnamed protein product [Rotaria socialis]CAF4503802.1 unnamed protein product [Rotaria socialis]CAF4619288.1 unnamed protein product [Rotaria socialis]